MTRYMLETDLPQYIHEGYYVVRDHKGKLLGVLPENFDAYNMIECVEEIPPEKPYEPPSKDGYDPYGTNWADYRYDTFSQGFLMDRLPWDVKPADPEKAERTTRMLREAIRVTPDMNVESYLNAITNDSLTIAGTETDEAQAEDNPDLSRD